MSERQIHGFKEEAFMREQYPLFQVDNSYSAVWDALIRREDIIGGNTKQDIIPVSIKTKRINQNVEMGSFYRNSQVSKDFLLSVAFWDRTTDNIVSREFILIPSDIWLRNFPNSLILKMNNIFVDNDITNSRDDDARWKTISKQYRELWNDANTGIAIHFKRDHKNQKRVQCSIRKNYFKDFLLPNYSVILKNDKNKGNNSANG